MVRFYRLEPDVVIRRVKIFSGGLQFVKIESPAPGELPGDLASPAKVSKSLTRGYLICFVGTVLWSSTAVFIRYLTENFHLPPLVLAFWRDLILTLALVITFALFRPSLLRLERHNLGFIILYGWVLSLFNSTWTISVALNGAAASTVLAYSSSAFTAVLGWRLFGEYLGIPKIVAVTLSLLGCVLVAGAYHLQAWQLNLLGVITGLTSGLAFATYSLFGKAAWQRGLNSWTTLLYAFGFATIFILFYNLGAAWLPSGVASPNLLYLSTTQNATTSPATGWLVLIILALGPTVGGYGLYTASLTYLPVSVANIIATTEPVMTALLAYLFLSEVFTTPQWAGSILIALGIVILRIGGGRN